MGPARRRILTPVHAQVALAAMLVAALALLPARAADLPPSAPAAKRDALWSRGLLFRLEKPGILPSFVFGTLHSGDPRVTTLSKPVLDALGAARTFAPEIYLSERDIDDFFAAAQFDDGRRLTDFFDGATIAEIRVALGPAAPPEATLVRLKPWAILLKLAEQPPARVDGGETLDRVLLDAAKRRKLTIVGLELLDEQVAAFDAIPLPSQVALVRFVVAHKDRLVRDHDAVIAAWQDRDLGRIAALNAEPGQTYPEIAPHMAELTRHLVENRSVQMAHRLFLPLRGGRVFVAVGALHLYGERGLLALLSAQGYRVRRVYRGRRCAMRDGVHGRWRKMSSHRRTRVPTHSTP